MHALSGLVSYKETPPCYGFLPGGSETQLVSIRPLRIGVFHFQMAICGSGQIITNSAEVTLKGGLVRESGPPKIALIQV